MEVRDLFAGKNHLKTHVEHFTLDCPFFLAIKSVLEEDQTGWTPCVGCKKLVGYTNETNLCLICSPLDQKLKTIEAEASQRELRQWSALVEKIACTNLTLHKGYPPGVSQAFSLALEFCHLAELEAKTDKELWRAKIQLAKLKAVWVVDLRGGAKNGRTWLEKVRRRCNLVLVGKIDSVWEEAITIEKKRKSYNAQKKARRTNGIVWMQKKKPTKNSSSKHTNTKLKDLSNPFKSNYSCSDHKLDPIDDERMSEDETLKFLDIAIKPLPKDMQKTYLAAKKLVNLGELSKAMMQFKTLGVAPITPLVKKEVDKKFERVDVPPAWPETGRIRERRRAGREGIHNEALKDVIPHEDEYVPPKGEWWKYHQKVKAQDILNAISKIRRTTAGGLNGITPWQYRKAIEHSPSNSLANTLAGLANRVGENHFSQSIGAQWASGRLIPLIQRENACQEGKKPKLKLRPIVVGDTARRILVRAYDTKVKQDVTAICSNHQLSVLKGGYDIGIHAVREELKRC